MRPGRVATRPRKTSQKRIKGLQEAAANFYISAVEQGQTNLAIVRRATDLLYATGRSSEVSQLWNRLPAGSIVGGGLQDQAAVAALRNRDFQRAYDLTRQAVEAHPDDFRERFFLAQILRLTGKPAEAVAELRKGVDLAPTDPDRWLNLILFLVQSGQLEDAEKVIPQAEAALPKDKAPLYLARYCAVLGLAYQEKKQEAQKTKWCDAANSRFKKAREAMPDDPSVSRMYTEFLISTGQIKEVEAHLKAILARAPLPGNMEEISLARRTLAAILISRNDFQASHDALKLFEPNERGGAGQGLGEQPALKSEDLQTLAHLDTELDALKVDAATDPSPTSGFQRVVQRAILHVQSSGRDEVTGANVLVALVQRARELCRLFPAAAGHEPPRCGQLHQPRRRQGRQQPTEASTPKGARGGEAGQGTGEGQDGKRAQAIHRRPQREGQERQGRSADRPRAGGRSHDPDPVPPVEEQPALCRRSRRRQDRDRRRPGAQDRRGRRARRAASPR